MVKTKNGNYVWEIGGPPPARLRFSQDWFNSADCSEPIFVVGKSDPKTDWPLVHPGPLNASTGFRELSATILFEGEINSAQHGHILEIEAREVSGPCPDLLIAVNGHSGIVIPDAVRVDRSHGPSVPSPTAGIIRRNLWIPPGLVVSGSNRLVITTIATLEVDPQELIPAMRPDLGWLFGSAIGWERLALREVEEHFVQQPAQVHISMLPLFVREENGSVHELVDVIAENLTEFNQVEIELNLEEKIINRQFQNLTHEFGDIRMRVPIPEFLGEKLAIVKVKTASATVEIKSLIYPSRKWTVHLIPHVHLDIGYTDVQAKVIEVHNRNIDKVLDIVQRNSDYSFSIDGSFSVETFMASRSEKRIEDLMSALREGSISVNALWALILSGIASLEDFYRAMYFAAELRRKHGVQLRYANLTDVPSYTSALPSILVAAGIDSFVGISNHTRGGNADSDALHLLSPVRWRGPDGSSVLAYFSDHYSQLRLVCADPPTIAGVAQGLTTFLRRYERTDYLPTDFPLLGTHSDNEDLSHGYADLIKRWSDKYVWPRLQYSTMADYLDSVRPLFDNLPELVGDGGSFWEDGVGTQACAVAVHRRTQAMLPGVESLSSLSASLTEGAIPDFGSLDEAWRALLIGSEHTWTWAHTMTHPHSRQSLDQLDWKVARIERGHRLAVDEMRRALSQLAELINASSLPSILVFNPSSWKRDLIFDFEIRENEFILDSTNSKLDSFQVGEVVDGLKILRTKLPEVPGFGFCLLPISNILSDKKIESRPGSQSPLTKNPEPSEVPKVLETIYYRIEIDVNSGTVTSLWHKELNVELLDSTSGYFLGDVLYVAGGGSAEGRGLKDEVSSIYDYTPDLPEVNLTITGAEFFNPELHRTPWGWILVSTGKSQTLPFIRREVEFFDHSDEVSVRINLQKEATLSKESVYVSFPFAISNPIVRYDRQQGWVNPQVDHHIGACNEWLTIQNSVTLTADNFSVAWSAADAPLFTVSDVVRGTWAREFKATNGVIFSWVMNNYWMTNTPAQQSGNLSLSYSFQPSKKFDPIFAGRLGRELRSSALVSDLLHTDRGDNERRPMSANETLWEIDVPENVVVTILAARNGAQFTVRMQEVGGDPTRFRLTHPGLNSSLHHLWGAFCTATEDVLEVVNFDTDGSVEVELKPWQVRTLCFGNSQLKIKT